VLDPPDGNFVSWALPARRWPQVECVRCKIVTFSRSMRAVTSTTALDGDSRQVGVALFKKSTFCTVGSCVEVAIAGDNQVRVRDSKDLSIQSLTFTSAEWRAFVRGVKNGEFDV
jgi:hypothetical protein